MAPEYVFVDEWDVDAPPEAVFDAIADARTYPDWWKPVYITVEADGPPEVGRESRQHFKGRLPYTLKTTSKITSIERPRTVAADVVGPAREGLWTLTPRRGPGGWRPGRALSGARQRRASRRPLSVSGGV